MTKNKGFTLVELMIVVAIIGILAAIATPKLTDTIRRTQEARTKGNLGALRSALAVYYSDTEGLYPQDNLESLTLSGKYLAAIPGKHTPPYHPEGNEVLGGTYLDVENSRADWGYGNVLGDVRYGLIWVNCTHTDLSGRRWDEQ